MRLCLLTTCFVLLASTTLGDSQDTALLLQAPWADTLGWTPTVRTCRWTGVVCVGDDVVSL